MTGSQILKMSLRLDVHVMVCLVDVCVCSFSLNVFFLFCSVFRIFICSVVAFAITHKLCA